LSSPEAFWRTFPFTETSWTHFTPSSAATIIINENATNTPITSLTDKVRLAILYARLRLSYAGSRPTTSADAIQNTVQALHELQYNPRATPSTTGPATTPAGLFHRFEAIIVNLPHDRCNEWGINLLMEFMSKLPDPLIKAIRRHPDYEAETQPGGAFDIRYMTTKARQEAALETIRTIASACAEEQETQRAFMSLEFQRLQESAKKPGRSNHLGTTDPTSNHLGPSQAETVMGRYSEPPPPPQGLAMPGIPNSYPSRPEYSQLDALGYPHLLDPNTHPTACLGCYDPGHKFYDGICPLYQERHAKDRMSRNIGHRRDVGNILPKGHERSKPGNPRAANSSSHYGPAPVHGLPPANPRPGAYHAATTDKRNRDIDNRPAWQTQGARPGSPAHKAAKTGDSQILCHLSIPCNQISLDPATRLLPAPIDNGLPHIRMPLTCASVKSEASLSCLYDTGSAMTVGWTPHHLWTFMNHPHLVHSFEMFNDENPFSPLKLYGAIANPDTFNTQEHGALTAVIRYYVHPQSPTASPHLLTVALGNDVQVNTILGWPAAQSFGLDLLVSQDLFDSTTLKTRFKVYRQPTNRKLPDDAEAPDPTETYASKRFQDLRQNLPTQPTIQATDRQEQGYLQRSLQLSN